MILNSEQVAFFKVNGYLMLPGALDLDLCAVARDALWASLPATSKMERDDPVTHIGPFSENDTRRDPLVSRVGYLWQLRDNGTDENMIRLLYSDALMAIGEQLLGEGMVRQPVVGGTVMGSQGYAWPDGPVDPAQSSQGIRGTYGTLPFAPGATITHPDSKAHTDGHPFMLSMVGLIDDCSPDGGAFTVWPKSHSRFYPKFWMQYDQARIPYYEHMPSFKGLVNPPEYYEELARILDDTRPVDCWGKTGDVVLWHHRMLHSARENHSSVIRQAVLADYNRTDLDQLRLDPPQPDMWRDWSQDLKDSSGEYSEEFARQQRCVG